MDAERGFDSHVPSCIRLNEKRLPLQKVGLGQFRFSVPCRVLLSGVSDAVDEKRLSLKDWPRARFASRLLTASLLTGGRVTVRTRTLLREDRIPGPWVRPRRVCLGGSIPPFPSCTLTVWRA